MSSVQGRTMLLTGASSGIGAQAARELAARGAKLALVARREDRLKRLSADIAGAGHERPLVLAADLGQPGQAADVATRAIEAFGPIDVLINNAGTSVQALTWIAGDRAEARSVFETNLWSPLALVAAVAPQMIERGKGVIVNTGSMVQVSPFPHLGHYCASRAAVAQLTQTLQLELGLRGIRVVEVAFGAIDTAASTENRMLRGGPKWLDGRPGLGKLDDAALTLVQAVEGTAEGVVFYPSVLRWVHVFPGFGRRHARRAARKADLADTTLRVGGSAGSAEIRAARERWEAQHVQTS